MSSRTKRIHFPCEFMEVNPTGSRSITQSDIRFRNLADALGLVRQCLGRPCCEIRRAFPWIALYTDAGKWPRASTHATASFTA